MNGLILFFVRRPVTSIMVMAAVYIAAFFSFSALPLERFPELTVPRVTVETVYHGMAAEDVRSLVTIPVEDAFSSVKGIDQIHSVSRDGSSLIRLDFRWGTNPMSAAALVREAVDTVYPTLPHGILKPNVLPGDPDNEPHAIIAVRSLSEDESYARRLADFDLRSKLRRIDGIGSVQLVAGEVSEGNFKLDIQRFAALGYSANEFARVLSMETADIPAGNVREGSMEMVVVSSGKLKMMEDFENLAIPLGSSHVITGDVGEVKMEAARKKSVYVLNGMEVTALEIYRRPGADPVRLSKDINKFMAEATRQYSHNAEIFLIKDSSPALVNSMIDLIISAVIAALIVIIVLFLFFRQLRTCALAAMSIPFSIAVGICVLGLTGRSLNSMSLGGLALGIGLVSDISVIMLDLLNRSFGILYDKPLPEIISDRAASISGSSISSTVTTAVVFVPVIFLPGALGNLFGDTSISLVASIFAGWFYSQFLIPSLFRFTIKNKYHRKESKNLKYAKNEFNVNKNTFEKKYRKSLIPILRHPLRWYFAVAILCVFGIFMLFINNVVFVSPDDAEEVLISIEFPSGTIMENIGNYGVALSGIISELPYIKTAYGRAGAEDEETSIRSNIDYRREELIIHCLPDENFKTEKAYNFVMEKVNQLMEKEEENINSYFSTGKNIPSCLGYSVYLSKDKTETHLGLSSTLNYAVNGKDINEVKERSNMVIEKISDKTNFNSFRMHPSGRRPEFRFYPNRETIAYFGVSSEDIANLLFVMNDGLIVTEIDVDGHPVEIKVSANIDTIKNGNYVSLENFPIITPQGKSIFLGSLGNIERLEADAVLARQDRSDVIYIEMPKEKKLTDEINFIDNIFSWFFKANESVFAIYWNSILVTVFIAIILMYMTMGAQFESFLLPLILMLTIPFGLAGTGPALFLFGSNLDSGAIIGLCTLFGLVVNNGLILFEVSQERINLGYNTVLAVYKGASIRLRPVIITTLTTIFALIPIILNPFSSMQKSMAVAMLGGLIASTCLSLFILPSVFIKFFTWRKDHAK